MDEEIYQLGPNSWRKHGREVGSALACLEKAQSDYHKACEHVWDVLYHRIPDLEEVLKIGKRGYKTRMLEARGIYE